LAHLFEFSKDEVKEKANLRALLFLLSNLKSCAEIGPIFGTSIFIKASSLDTWR